MKFLLIIPTVFLFSCESRHESSTHHQDKDSTTALPTEVQYSRADLLQFFDSIGNSDCSHLKLDLIKDADSVFSNTSSINQIISVSDFEKLKRATKLGKLDLKTAKGIFKFPLDSHFIKNDSVEISYFPFDKIKSKFGKFALVIGSFSGSWENDIYFFDGMKVLSKHHNFHKNGDGISWFVDSDGNTVIYYRENFGGGSGIWQYNFFFYKYSNGGLIPALNILENGNLHFSSEDFRHFWFETFVVSTVPLKLKFVFSYELSDRHNNWIEVKKDSTEVDFLWDRKSATYIGQFPDDLNLTQIYSYFIGSNVDLYTICIDNKYLRSILFGQDSVKSNLVYIYLNKIKNDIGTN